MTPSPQQQATDPGVNAWVSANAGSGKTTTLVNRVARLLLAGAAPETVLCLTYTKAAAAEMQRRLFDTLGAWSVLDDAGLRTALLRIGDSGQALPRARTLFARALETPGGLKIQTIHAFCEKLLRRFPLEAGVTPGFAVLEGAEAAEVQALARERLAELALSKPAVGDAYAHMAVELAPQDFEGLFTAFECERERLADYLHVPEGVTADVWRRCGFPDGAPRDPEALEREAAAGCRWERWREAAHALQATGSVQDGALAGKLLALVECAESAPGDFPRCLAVFSTTTGEPLRKLGTKSLDPRQLDWLVEEQARLHDACGQAKAARMAVDTVHALTLAGAYVGLYAGAKSARGALDFADLIRAARELLTERADAAWVLYKLDGGIDHVLIDEAQDTAPDQWAIARALTADFFAGEGSAPSRRPRTVFAVGDPKQSIYGFQGADPLLFGEEGRRYAGIAADAERTFVGPALEESWRSTGEVLAFVDRLGEDPAFRESMAQPEASDVFRHVKGRRDAHAGAIDLWPPEVETPREEPDAWDAPVDDRADEGANKRLARRIAREVADMCARGDAVWDARLDAPRPVHPGDVLILVRRRAALFEEILRALKKARVPVAGADRLRLSEHVVFKDVVALLRFVLFPWDDLTLAALLRSPFCPVDEAGLFDLAHDREEKASLYAVLNRRGHERPDWAEALRFLGDAREMAAGRGPFDFLGRALSWLDREGRTLRQRVLTRLGPEAEDALDEMLAAALGAESRGVTDLERFAAELERADLQVKRELEGAGEAVRVMTVHGAKGLEAPVVILPETCMAAQRPRDPLLRTADGAYLFAPRKADDIPASREARELREAEEAAEGLRLLYVALTRARDRVILCGRLPAPRKEGGESRPPEGCWYARLAAAFDDSPQVHEAEAAGLSIRRWGADPVPALALTSLPAADDPAPAWLRAPAPAEPEASRWASPSTVAEGRRGPAPSPLSSTPGGLGRFRRGELIHRLLQLLPDLPAADRPAAAGRILGREPDLSDEQRREMARAALGVLEDPRFAELWGPGGRAEAAIAGAAPDLPEGLAISGRVDRIEGADPAYLTQMAVYAAVLRAVFPGRRVEAALVWTDGPKLMPVPDNVIDARLAALRLGR